MGFGSFLKKAINPLTPFKAAGNAGKNLLKGNVKGALRNVTLDAATMGLGPGQKRRSMGRTFNAAAGAPGFERLAQMPGPHGALARGWLAKNPAQQPAPVQPQPATSSTPTPSSIANLQLTGGQIQPVSPPAQPGMLQQGIAQILQGQEDPYEAWKAGGRQGERPAGY